MNILITGGAGFIGSALVRYLIEHTDYRVLNLDKLTYAGNLQSLTAIEESSRYEFVEADICDSAVLGQVLDSFCPDRIIHLAAETHVDRSVDGPAAFIQSNVVGTFTLLQETLRYWQAHSPQDFLFHHVSTDEVYGSLGDDGAFTEQTAYSPSSPYSASKASSDHLVRAWYKTYGLPTLISNCSNNYGPYQFPEKLIPLVILNAVSGRKLPVYGSGKNVRDWLYVDDHVRAIMQIAIQGSAGATYNIGGGEEQSTLAVVHAVCRSLCDWSNRFCYEELTSLIDFVDDRPGHDWRYAIDSSKLRNELEWKPVESFETGMAKTTQWYLENASWHEAVTDGSYRGERLGRV